MVLPEPDRPLTMKKLMSVGWGGFIPAARIAVDQRLLALDEILHRVVTPVTQDVGAHRHLDQHRQVAAGRHEQHHLRHVHVEHPPGPLLRLQAVDAAHLRLLELFEAHDEVQPFFVAHGGLAAHHANVEDAEAAHLEKIGQAVEALADQHVRADADEFHRVVGDQAMAARQQFQGDFALADAGLAGDQQAHAHDFHVHAVDAGARRECARQVVLQVVDDHRAGLRRGEQREFVLLRGPHQVGRRLAVAGHDHGRGAVAAEQLFQGVGALRFAETVEVVEFGAADDLHAVGVDKVEVTDQRHARVLGIARFQQAAAAVLARHPLEFQGRGLGVKQVLDGEGGGGHARSSGASSTSAL